MHKEEKSDETSYRKKEEVQKVFSKVHGLSGEMRRFLDLILTEARS